MSETTIWVIFFSMTFLEMTAFYIFFHSFFENRINGVATAFLSCLIIISVSLFMDWFGHWKPLAQAFVFVVLCHSFYRASWKQAAFFSMLYLSAAWLWDITVVGLTWRWAPFSYERPAIIITYVSKAVFILFILFIKKIFAPAWDVGLYSGKEWNRVIFIPVISVIYGIYFYTKLITIEADAATVMGIISAILLSIDVVFYKIIQDMVRERQELQIATVKGQKMQSRIDAYNEMEGLLRLQRKKLHDYKNQVQTIAGLIDDGREKEAGSLAKQLAENLSVDSSVVDTKNATINAILNQKYCTSKERGIGMTFVVGDLSGVSLPAVEIIIIIGNLLDNAITECEKVKGRDENPVIRVTATDEGQFVFSVKNPVLEDVVIDGNSVVKKYEPGHGIGLSNVWDVAEKYDGSFGINCDGKNFNATVVI